MRLPHKRTSKKYMANSLVKTAVVFKDEAGQTHESALKCLLANKRIAIRGLIQQGTNGIPLKNGHVTVEDAVQIVLERAKEFSAVVNKYDKAINRERTKANPIPVN